MSTAVDFVTAFAADWQRFEDALQASAQLRDSLASTEYSPEEKEQLLAAVFAGQLDAFTLDLIKLLLRQENLDAVAIGSIMRELLNSWRNTVTVRLTTAAPLPAEQEQALTASLKERYGNNVTLKKTVDPGLSDGVLLKVDNKVSDGGVKSRADFLAALVAEPLIGNAAKELLRRYRDVQTVRLTTAAPLPAAEEQTLVSMLQDRCGQEIVLEKNLDQTLIGGAVLKIGDMVFDGSIKSQLAALEKDLLKGN